MTAALSDAKRQLLEKMLRGGGEAAAPVAGVRPRPPGTIVPLTADQRQVWLHAMMAPDVPLYNESITIHRLGAFDLAALERSLEEIVRRHEAWRTCFAEVDGELVQRIRSDVSIRLLLDDVSHLPAEERDAAAIAIGSDDARRPIDLAEAPLFRARVVRLAEDNHRLYLTLHHIIFDGVSIYRVIVPELAALYQAFSTGAPSPLPEPVLQYGDYAVWQQAHLASPAIARQLDHWRATLADAPSKLELTGDRAKPTHPTHAGSMETFPISHGLTEALKAVSRREGVTLYMTLLAAYKAMLHLYTGEEDIVVGGVTDLRRRPELERVVGYFLNTIAMRSRPTASLPVREYLHQVRDSVLGALAASEVPFDEVVRDLGIRRQPGAHPLFNTLFSIEPPVDPFPEGWDLTQMDVVVGGAKFDLYLELDERPDGMIGRFLYSTELFDPATIRRMIGHWLNMLEGIAEDAGRPIGDLPLLTREETALIVAINDTSTPVGPPLPDAIAASVRARPEAIAVRCGEDRCTYAELDLRAGRIAAALQARGVGRGALVALCLDRSPDMVAALLAVMKCGAAYLPLDLDFPAQRLDYIVRDAGIAALLTERRLLGTLPAWEGPVLLVEEAAELTPADAVTVAPEDLAYVLYTSGSTGRPKGVEIGHGALANLLESMRVRPGFAAEDSLLAVTTLSFDIAALEIFLPLICGGTLVLAPRAVATDPVRLAALLRETRPTMMQATPATWRALIETGWRGDPNLTLLCGGEALPRELALELLARAGTVWNMYGPTETTIWSTMHRVTPEDGPVPIGRPIANTLTHVLDKRGGPVPAGVTGELYIGGAGLARGYRNRPDLTAERFAEQPGVPGVRLYRTGDLARYAADGTLFCLGRTDNDQKIRGFRVAVEEIEGALAEHPEIAAAAVRSWPDASGERALAAYLVPRGQMPSPGELRAHLGRTLPEYMIPSRFQALAALPMTPNGKIDRNALPSPDKADSAGRSAPPVGETETRLAAIWADLLGVGGVGREDSFFELGGHSLLVARLLHRIEMQWDRRIGMAEFFRAHRLAELAGRIDRLDSADCGGLVPLQPLGAGTPMIWLDGGPAMMALAREVGIDIPFLGLPLDPILERLFETQPPFEAVAREVVGTLRQAQPAGPYLIGGWCTAGILAYEVARQLREAGEEVPLLALGHAFNPVAFQRIGPLRMAASKARFHAGVWLRLPLRERLDYAKARAFGMLEEAGVAEPDRPETRYRQLRGALERAAYGYRPGAYGGDVALFQPIDRPAVHDTRPGWADLVTGALTAYDIPGEHGTMWDQPNLASFGARLREAIIEARNGGRAGSSPFGRERARPERILCRAGS
ncbi:amino acid adenylation domain-containing protein [Sphingomonas parva]|uniref:Amino acid adenylation domain-containing protein n=1 Tax=Sphingomonas parva TaxID=2555898 RepID=A0A4Y8ZSM2_9SPHN|nr:non-ribosomal peptide synthetase [Sphingomonas parva]TFI59011.1 amino acid adenylation domain-containing protein [Sphingomonas parva]